MSVYWAVVSVYWAVMSVYWAVVSVYWAVMSVYWAVVSVYWAVVSVYWAVVSVYWAVVSVHFPLSSFSPFRHSLSLRLEAGLWQSWDSCHMTTSLQLSLVPWHLGVEFHQQTDI
ncbi:hypothetical protein ACOMHN_004288 [Nucella lapillus]